MKGLATSLMIDRHSMKSEHIMLTAALFTLCFVSQIFAQVPFVEVMTTDGTAWADYNNDNFPDIFGKSTYWENDYADNPGTPFIEFTAALPSLSATWNTSMGDYNNDGFVDAWGYIDGQNTGNQGGKPKLYRNDSGTGWTEVSDIFQQGQVAPGSIHIGHVIMDLDADGFLDLYATSWVTEWVSYPGPPDKDEIYMSSGGTSFSNTWQAPARYGKGVTHADFDNDGDQDVYVSNYWLDEGFLWVNNGFNGTTGLTDESLARGAYDGPGHTQGSCFGDFSNDGNLDLFIANFAHPGNPKVRFLLNTGPPGYTFRNEGTKGIIQVEPFDSEVPADFDNDGDLDIFATTHAGYGPIPARLYANNGSFADFQMSDVSETYGLTNLISGTSHAAWGDFNNDGFLDLIADGRLWENPGATNWPDNHFLKLKLQGGMGNFGLVNQSAIGTQVRVDVPGLGTVTRQVEGGTGLGMQSDLTVHLGLGTDTAAVNVEIFWTDGTIQELSNVAVDQYLIVPILADPIPVEPPVSIPCEDIIGMQAACRNGEIVAGIKLVPGSGYDGESVEFEIDNNIHEATITNDRAVVRGIFPGPGNHKVKLVNPADCLPRQIVTCTDSFGVAHYDGDLNSVIESAVLNSNYPNPFNPTTTIGFSLPHQVEVRLAVYDLSGREISTLVRGSIPAGYHEVIWDGTNSDGEHVASGIYLYRLTAGDPGTRPGQGFVETRKMLLVR